MSDSDKRGGPGGGGTGKKKKITEVVKPPPPKRKPQEEDIEEVEQAKKVKPSSAPVYPSKIRPSKAPVKPSKASVKPSKAPLAIQDENAGQAFERKFVKNKFIKPRTVPIPRSIPSGDADHEFMPQAMQLVSRGRKMIGSMASSMASSLRQAAQEKMAGVAASAAETGKKAFMSTATGQIMRQAMDNMRGRRRLKQRIKSLR
jgi:hypothetical protein